MEILAVLKAVTKAHELVSQLPGQLKTIAIYTDSTHALNMARWGEEAVGQRVQNKARALEQLGATISLHWCPSHSGVSDDQF